MNIAPAGQLGYETRNIEETEFALAISPARLACEQVNGTPEPIRWEAPARPSRMRIFGDDELTDSLTFGWAIALAIAVALVLHISGA
jgi:hypothetical protein